MSLSWFQDVFGFEEAAYAETRSKFRLSEDGHTLTSIPSGASFHVGPFECVSLGTLEARILKLHTQGSGNTSTKDTRTDTAPAVGLPCDMGCGLGCATFKNITGSAKVLHQDASKAGSVFQAASQFNCLEMVGPGVTPEHGISMYIKDKTQGPACALACPAATAFRNYLVGRTGQGGGNQINTVQKIQQILGRKKYWSMRNGYLIPKARGSMAELGDRLGFDPELASRVMRALEVGCHWSTEVHSRRRAKVGRHRVCQVFCSACPVAYAKSTKSTDWATFAGLVLEGAYRATLAIATLLAHQRRSRVTVYLTAVGGGAFGNRQGWIVAAITAALRSYETAPLDVRLVHYKSGGTIGSIFKPLGKVLKKARTAAQARAREARAQHRDTASPAL